MNCVEFRERVVELLDAGPDPGASGELRDHLSVCTACAGLYEELRETMAGLAPAHPMAPSAGLKERVMNEIVNAAPGAKIVRKPWLRLWKPTVAAAAAMLLVAVFFLYSPSGRPAVAFADVVRNLGEFRPYSCLESVEANGKVGVFARHFFVSRTVRRSEFPGGSVIVFDLDARSELWLSPEEKKAVKHVYPYLKPGQHASVYDMVEKWTKLGGGPESLGTKRVEGKECSGFHSSDGQYNDITVWVDNQTLLPVRTEVIHLQDGNKIISSEFQFDTDLDPALYSLEPPEGYAFEGVVEHKQ